MKLRNKAKVSAIFFASVFFMNFLLPMLALGQGQGIPPVSGGKILDPLRSNGTPDIPALINKIVDGLLLIGVPIIALILIYCGFLFVFALGNPEKLKKAKEALLWTVVGAAVFLGATLIAKLIVDTITAVVK